MSLKRKIVVIGLGYVGLTLAVALGRISRVIAYDSNLSRVLELQKGHDRNLEVDDDALAVSDLLLTSDPKELGNGDFYIIAVPTPLNKTGRLISQCCLRQQNWLENVLKREILLFTNHLFIPELQKSNASRCLKKAPN